MVKCGQLVALKPKSRQIFNVCESKLFWQNNIFTEFNCYNSEIRLGSFLVRSKCAEESLMNSFWDNINISPKTFQTSETYRGCKITSWYFRELSCTRPSVYEISFCENFSLTGQTGGRKGVKNSTPTVRANFQDWKFHISYIARSKERKLCFVTRNVSETGLSFFKASKKNLRSSDHYRWFLMKRCQMFLWGAPNPLKAVPADFGQSSTFLISKKRTFLWYICSQILNSTHFW